MSEEEFPDGVKVITVGPPGGGMYNLIFPGGFERGRVLLPLLGIGRFADVGRFRDIWVEFDGTGGLLFHLYTRNGGGNRDDQAEAITELQAHPGYVRDADDSFDHTYASFWFRVPDQLIDLLRPVANPPIDTADRWREAINKLAGADD